MDDELSPFARPAPSGSLALTAMGGSMGHNPHGNTREAMGGQMAPGMNLGGARPVFTDSSRGSNRFLRELQAMSSRPFVRRTA